MVLPCNLWPRAAIEGDMRHTSTGATLPYWSVLLQMISVLVQEHMTTHTPASSPSLSQKRDQLSHRGSCPSLGAASWHHLNHAGVESRPLRVGPGLDRDLLGTSRLLVEIEAQHLHPTTHQNHAHGRPKCMPQLLPRCRGQAPLIQMVASL